MKKQVTKDTLSDLRNPLVTKSWRKIRTLVGKAMDEVAGQNCSSIKMTVGWEGVPGEDPMVGGQADIVNRSFRVLSARDLKEDLGEDGDWVAEYYATIFHETGHVAWGEACDLEFSRTSSDDVNKGFTPFEKKLLIAEDPLGNFAQFRAFLMLDLVCSELLARVFAVRMGDALVTAHPQSEIARTIAHATWERLLNETDSSLFASEGRLLIDACAILLTDKLGADPRKMETMVRRAIPHVLQDLLVWVPASERGFDAALSRAILKISKRYPNLHASLMERDYGDRWEPLELHAEGWKQLRLHSPEEVTNFLDSIAKDPCLLAWKTHDWAALCRELRTRYTDRDHAATIAVNLATHYINSQQPDIARAILRAVVENLQDTGSWYIARDRLRQLR